jgi:acyl-CoA synthetase (AMP-forming)/AMP-acid ligase II
VDPPPDVADQLRRWARETPAAVAVTYGDASWTWSELTERVTRLAAALSAAGLLAGDRIAVLDKNHPTGLETTYAAAMTGVVAAVVNWRLTPDEVAFILADAQARWVFVGAEFMPVMDKIRHRLPAVDRVVVVGGREDEYETLLSAADLAARPSRAVDPDECFLQLYTSGTTGLPKGAMLTHRGVVSLCRAGADLFDLHPDTVALVAMPLYHVGGTTYALLAHHQGGRIVLMREVVPDAMLATIAAERVTDAFLAPVVYSFLLDAPGFPAADLSSLRILSYGGGPMPPPLLRRCLSALPCELVQVYGMTELSGAVTLLDARDHRQPARAELLMSAGKAMPGVELQIVEPTTGDVLGPRQTGELWVRTAQVMAGYWRRPEATANTIVADGWLRTGDAGFLDEDGYLFIRDRVTDLIITGGENVYPVEVENALGEHPVVAEAAVIGIPDDVWGESVKAVVVTTEPVDPQELIAFCRDRLAGYKCPKSVDFVSELPRNLTGKILRRQLREPYWAGRDRRV